MEPEFSRASVATLIAAIIGSILDSEDGAPESRRPLLPQPGEVVPGDPQGFELLMKHFAYRVSEIGGSEAPARLRREYRDLSWMLQVTLEHQQAFGSSDGLPQ